MSSDTPAKAPVAPRRRDPEARRRAIVAAASELLVEGGGDLTHRRVADRAAVPLGATTYYFSSLDELREEALVLLGRELEDALVEFRRDVTASAGNPVPIAEFAHAYLSDRHRVGVDTALYLEALRQPHLRELAVRWFDGVVETLSAWTDPACARSVAVYMDGAALHAMLHDEPLDLDTITRAVVALMPPRASTTEENA